jgi:hypothetical protein
MIALHSNERGDDATREERSDDGERGDVADVDELGGEDLDPDEGEDERDRLVGMTLSVIGR